jgi:carbonic anhydrase
VFLNPGDYLTVATRHSLRNILDRSLLVIQASANKLLATFGPDVARNPGYRQALIEASIVTNAALAAYSIQQEFEASEQTEMRAVYGVYLLETREVWAPRLSDVKGIGLAAAPRRPRRICRPWQCSCSIGANCFVHQVASTVKGVAVCSIQPCYFRHETDPTRSSG